MSPNYSFILKGDISEDLLFPVGSLANITEGQWRLAINSLGFTYYENVSSVFVTVSSNYVTGQTINEKQELLSIQTPLSMMLLFGSQNSKKIIGLKNRDYFLITDAQHLLKIRFRKTKTNEPISGITVVAHVFLERIR